MIFEAENIYNRLVEFSLLTDDEIAIFEEHFFNAELNQLEKTEYLKFLDDFNKITGFNYKPEKDCRKLFNETSYLYSLPDKIRAVKNSLKDSCIIEDKTKLSPKWILKIENLQKYINYKPDKKSNQA